MTTSLESRSRQTSKDNIETRVPDIGYDDDILIIIRYQFLDILMKIIQRRLRIIKLVSLRQQEYKLSLCLFCRERSQKSIHLLSQQGIPHCFTRHNHGIKTDPGLSRHTKRLARESAVELLWVSGNSRVNGNNIADNLTGLRAGPTLVGPESAIGIFYTI